MRISCALLILSMSVMPGLAPGQDTGRESLAYELPDDLVEQAVALRTRALEGTGAFKLVESLTTEVGHRFAGTHGDRAAVAWALLKLKALGFSNVRAEPVTVPRWVRGEISVKILEPFPRELVAIALGGSVGTPDGGIEAPVFRVDDLEALKAADPAEVKGTIVFIADRMQRTKDGSGYGKAVGKRVRGASVAAAKGARGVIIRSVGTSRARIAHTGMTRYEEDVEPIPAVAVSNADADMIGRQLATGRDVVVNLELTSRRLPDAQSANVIGEIPGAASEAGIVLLSAHLDSWDVGTGAVDDGAGVAVAMEAARLSSEAGGGPRRTIRVVLYANEEFGLSGAKAYADAHADEIERHVLAMEADFGAGRVWQLASNVPDDKRPLVEAMHELLAPLDVALGGNDSGGGADINALVKRGVPTLAPRQDATHYFDVHHTISDTLDKLDPESLDQNVAVYATLAYLAANLETDFGRLPAPEDGEEGIAQEE